MENGMWTMVHILKNIENTLFYLFILFLPTQLGKHFWPDFSLIQGIRVDYLSPTLSVTDVLLVMLLLLWCFRKYVQWKNAKFKVSNPKQPQKLGFAIYVLFIAWLLTNIIFSHNPLNGLYHLVKFLEFSFVFSYIAITIKTKQQLLKVVVLLSIGVIGESLVAIAQFVKQGSLGGLFYFLGERTFTGQTPGIANASINGTLILRPYGTFPHPNVLAGFLVCVMTLAFFLSSTIKGPQKAVIFAALLVGTGALLLTMSRVAIVLWFLILIASVFRFPPFYRVTVSKRKRNQWMSFLFLGLLLFGMLASPVGTRLFHTHLSEQSVTEREALIASTVFMIQKHPLVGVGLGNYLPTLATQTNHPVLRNLYLQPVHMMFLLVFAELGLIGFLIFLFFLVKTYQQIIHDKIFLIVLSTILILGVTDHYWITLQQGQLFFSLFLGLCWAKITKT